MEEILLTEKEMVFLVLLYFQGVSKIYRAKFLLDLQSFHFVLKFIISKMRNFCSRSLLL